jgi:hypothetical protein
MLLIVLTTYLSRVRGRTRAAKPGCAIPEPDHQPRRQLGRRRGARIALGAGGKKPLRPVAANRFETTGLQPFTRPMPAEKSLELGETMPLAAIVQEGAKVVAQRRTAEPADSLVAVRPVEGEKLLREPLDRGAQGAG